MKTWQISLAISGPHPNDVKHFGRWRRMIIAIHQPNYLPWLSYFGKIAAADDFIFLDDAQFPKNSYTNRVQVLAGGAAKWLTMPVTFRFGDAINAVMPAQQDWARRHLDSLKGYYRRAKNFRRVWTRIEEIYLDVPNRDIAASNRFLVETLAKEFGLTCQFHAASDIESRGAKGDARLVELANALCPGATYLSGSGGRNYQSEDCFAKAGIELRYIDFRHQAYSQGQHEFVAGLSAIDAVFHLGWGGAADLIGASV